MSDFLYIWSVFVGMALSVIVAFIGLLLGLSGFDEHRTVRAVVRFAGGVLICSAGIAALPTIAMHT